jgi:hypothetical protein
VRQPGAQLLGDLAGHPQPRLELEQLSPADWPAATRAPHRGRR